MSIDMVYGERGFGVLRQKLGRLTPRSCIIRVVDCEVDFFVADDRSGV